MHFLGSISTMPGPFGLIAPTGQTEITSGISQPLSFSALIGGRSRWTPTMPMSAQEPSPQLLMQPEPEIFSLAGRQSVVYSLMEHLRERLHDGGGVGRGQVAVHVAGAAGRVVQRAVGAADREADPGQPGDQLLDALRGHADELDRVALGDAEKAFRELIGQSAEDPHRRRADARVGRHRRPHRVAGLAALGVVLDDPGADVIVRGPLAVVALDDRRKAGFEGGYSDSGHGIVLVAGVGSLNSCVRPSLPRAPSGRRNWSAAAPGAAAPPRFPPACRIRRSRCGG